MSRAVALQEKFGNRYPRESCGIGMVHLGIGAFHRAHQAWYSDKLLSRHPGNWPGISPMLTAILSQNLVFIGFSRPMI